MEYKEQANLYRQKVCSCLGLGGMAMVAGDWGVTASEYGIFIFLSDKNVLKLDCGDGCTTLYVLKLNVYFE